MRKRDNQKNMEFEDEKIRDVKAAFVLSRPRKLPSMLFVS